MESDLKSFLSCLNNATKVVSYHFITEEEIEKMKSNINTFSKINVTKFISLSTKIKNIIYYCHEGIVDSNDLDKTIFKPRYKIKSDDK